MSLSLSQAFSTWIPAARILLRKKGKVSLTTKRNRERRDIMKQKQKQLMNKEIAEDFLHAGEEILFVDCKSPSNYS